MSSAVIITMLSVGVASTFAEKLFIVMGKMDLANFCSIVGMVGMGGTAVGFVIEFIGKLACI